MKVLERVLIGSLVLQIILFAMGLSISYTSTHNGISDFSGLGAFIPFGIFGLLCIVNLILFIIYFINTRKKHIRVNIWLVFLVIIVIILVLGFNFAFHTVNRLPGSDLPGY